MSKLSKQDQETIIQQLDKLFTAVYLRCDGYYVFYHLTRHKKQLVIGCYINGWLKGEWLTWDKPMSEEARRFFRPATRSKMSPKELKSWEKIIGKRECKKRGFYDKIVFPMPWWNSARSLVRHLMKNNTSIEIISYETHKAAVDEIHKKEAAEAQA